LQFKKQYKQNENNKKTLDGLFEIFPKAHLDYRGFLVRIDDKEIFHNAGLKCRMGSRKPLTY